MAGFLLGGTPPHLFKPNHGRGGVGQEALGQPLDFGIGGRQIPDDTVPAGEQVEPTRQHL